MYDFDWTLPFTLGMNMETLIFALNVCIPLVYFLNFFSLLSRLRKFDKSAPYYSFVKGLVYFFFFYGLGDLVFLWYDFFYTDFEFIDPLAVLAGTIPSPPNEALQIWKVGILLQNVGLVLMLNELRGKVFQTKLMNWLPIVWEVIGISFMISLGLVAIPWISENAFFVAEINFLFNFTWSISLPLTYFYIYKNAAGSVKKYAFILFINFILYGLAWGFRTRLAVAWMPAIFWYLVPTPFTYAFDWLLRGAVITITLLFVLYAYRKLLESFD